MVPLVVRAMQNNFRSSVDGIEFERDGDSMFFIYTEGGVSYRLEIGFSDFKETEIDLHGEKYIVKAIVESKISKIYAVNEASRGRQNTVKYVIYTVQRMMLVLGVSREPRKCPEV